MSEQAGRVRLSICLYEVSETCWRVTLTEDGFTFQDGGFVNREPDDSGWSGNILREDGTEYVSTRDNPVDCADDIRRRILARRS